MVALQSNGGMTVRVALGAQGQFASRWGDRRGRRSHSRGPDDFGIPFVRDFLEAKGLHSTAWCWHPVLGPSMLEKDWRTPTEFGRFIREYLREHNR